MKGIIIYENDLRAINAAKLKHASFCCEFTADDITDTLKGTPVICKSANCNKEDTYDFEVGALIALMKLCGVEKVKKAAKETFFDVAENSVNEYEEKIHALEKERKRLNMSNCAKTILNNKLLEENSRLNYIKSCNESTIKSLENTRDLLINKNNELISDKDKSWKNYQRNIQKKQDRINELEAQVKASEDDKLKNIEYYEEKIEKLKTDCEKLQHGYLDTDMIFCGGRQNGKQHTLLVDLFKKIDQKKVDAAYKEAYNTTLPVWQKEALKQMYDIRKESKEKIDLPRTLDINGVKYRKMLQIKDFSNDQLDSLIEGSKYAIPYVDEWLYKIPTKREEMWEKIFALHKESDVIIKVKKEDLNTFLHEIENKIPEITWLSGIKIFETKYTIGDIYEALKTCDVIYFRVWKETKLSFSDDSHIFPYRELKHIDYLPPMRWDLFKKGRIVIGCTEEEVPEFREKAKRELGNIRIEKYSIENIHCNGPIRVYYHYDKDINWMRPLDVTGIPRVKINNHKVVYWEDVR